MKPSLDQLKERHRELLERFKLIQDREEDKKYLLPDLLSFVETLQAAGAYIPNEQQRDQLRDLLDFWASNIYELMEVYPDSKLEPFTQTQSTRFNLETLKNIPLRLWTLLGIIVFVIILFFVLIPKGAFIALITNSTLTPTAIATPTLTPGPCNTAKITSPQGTKSAEDATQYRVKNEIKISAGMSNCV